MNPKVSVVIPYYNDKKYIAETLESVSQQTYQNIEIILVDDGSTDEESVRVFDSIQLKDGEKLHEKNAGPSKARNLGISHASGKYILPLDADDKIAPSYIEKAVVVLEKIHSVVLFIVKVDFLEKLKENGNCLHLRWEKCYYKI